MKVANKRSCYLSLVGMLLNMHCPSAFSAKTGGTLEVRLLEI